MTATKWQSRPNLVRKPAAPNLEAVVELTQRELQASPYPAIQRLTCGLHEGRLVLQGQVRSYFLKQMAQVIAARVAVAVAVDNQVEVVD